MASICHKIRLLCGYLYPFWFELFRSGIHSHLAKGIIHLVKAPIIMPNDKLGGTIAVGA
jgi:hypothetical protein